MAKTGGIRDVVVWVIVAPYFVLIHVGMLVFVINLASNIIRKQFTIKISKIKKFTSVYGVAIGLLLPALRGLYWPHYDAPGPEIGNIPALLIGTVFVWDYGSWYRHPWFYFVYALFGLIGGWGLGQLIDWIINVFKKNRQDLASPG